MLYRRSCPRSVHSARNAQKLVVGCRARPGQGMALVVRDRKDLAVSTYTAHPAVCFEQFFPVVPGTTLGMMLANIPAVSLGHTMADKLPVKAIRIVAAIVFVALGALTLAGAGR